MPEITYYAYDMGLPSGSPVPILISELPYSGVRFSQRLNTPGSFSGALPLSDLTMSNKDVWDATRPSRTLIIVDVNGSIVWGGIALTRAYDNTTRMLQVSGMEAWSYFQQRVQPVDYTTPPTVNAFSSNAPTYWSANPVDLAHAAAQIVLDACSASGSYFTQFVTTSPGGPASGAIYIQESGPSSNTVTVTLPISQRQTIDSIVTTFAQTGYGTGFDFAIDWTWNAGKGSIPIPTLTISFPRRGRITTASPLVFDFNAADSWSWPEDGTQAANTIYATASGSGGISDTVSDTTPISDGYPLLEVVKSYSNLNDLTALDYAADDDLALLEWPVVTPVVTLPMFNSAFPVGSFIMGDDARVHLDSGDYRFPNGFDTYLRIIGMDCQVADEGRSQMTVSLSQRVGLAPVPQPPLS